MSYASVLCDNKIVRLLSTSATALSILFLALVLLCLHPSAAYAATITWTDGGGDGLWSNTANWSTNAVPGAGDTAVFNGTSVANATVDASYAGTVAAIQLNSGYTGTVTLARNLTTQGVTLSAGTFTISGYTLTLSGGSVTVNSGGTVVATNATTTFSGTNQTLTCSGTYPGVIVPATAGGGFVFTLASGCTATLPAGTLTDAGNFTINGTTTAPANTQITLSGGSMTIGASGSLTGVATTTFSGLSQTLTCSGTYPGVVVPATTASPVYYFTLAAGCTATLPPTLTDGGGLIIDGTTTLPSPLTVADLTINTPTTAPANTQITITSTSGMTIGASGSITGGLATTTFNGNSQTLTCSGTYPGVVVPATTASPVYYFTLAAGCTATLPPTLTDGGGLIIDGTTTLPSPLTVADLTINTPTTAPANTQITITSTSGMTIGASGSITGGLATTTFNGNSQTLTCSGTYPGFIVPATTGSAYTFTLASGCTASLSSALTNSGNLAINGTFNIVGNNLTANSLTIGSTGTLMLSGGQTTLTAPTLNSGSTVQYTGSGSYTLLKAGGSYSNLSITGSGSFATSSALTITGNFNQSAGTFTPSAPVTFSGAASTTATTSAGSDFSSVTINKTGGTGLTLAGSGLTTTGTLTLTAGTLDASTGGCSSASCNITVGGNWSNSGTFIPRTGTVTLNGTGQTLSGSTTFYNLTKSASTTNSLTFTASTTQTISNAMTFTGAASNLLSLKSSSNGVQWNINPQGTRTISYLNVTNSDNTNASAIDATGGTNVNGGDDTNWTFVILPTLTTSAASSILATSATLNGSITATGGTNATAEGFVYGVTTAYGATSTQSGSFGVASFNASVTGLSCNTTYHFESFATNSAGTSYGSDQSFTTSTCPPTLTTSAASSILATSATLNGSITATGGTNATAEGFVYGVTTAYGATSTQSGSFGVASFNASVTGLSCNTTYHFESFATNSAGTSYGSDQSFTTSTCPPTLTTSAASSILATSATLNGSITATGGTNATAEGFVYGVTTAYGATSTQSGSFGVASFNASVTGLSCNTTYHFESFATNSAGTSYGSDQSFTTSTCPPTLTTSAASSILATSATLNGSITATGGTNATAEGFVYGVTTAYGATSTQSGSFGVASFNASVTGLSCNTTYHFESFATNSAGTSYGSDQSFTTSTCPPTLTTSAASSILATSATLNGSITATGGTNATAEGFVYGVTTAYGATSTQSGSFGVASFNASVTGLSCNTTYHFESFATNSAGTSYGSDQSFTTSTCPPTLTTSAASSILSTSATLNGSITATGGTNATAKVSSTE